MIGNVSQATLATWATRGLPARLHVGTTAKLLGFAEHDVQILRTRANIHRSIVKEAIETTTSANPITGRSPSIRMKPPTTELTMEQTSGIAKNQRVRRLRDMNRGVIIKCLFCADIELQ
jgi:hypothetical protein